MKLIKPKRGMSLLDLLEATAAVANADTITREEFKRIRNKGTEEEIAEAVERMAAAGGYDNLE